MKQSGFVNAVILMVLLIGAAVGAATRHQWVLPLLLVCFTFWVIILLCKQDNLQKKNMAQRAQIVTLTAQVTSFENDMIRSTRLTRHDD